MCGLWGAISRKLSPNELENAQVLGDLSKYRGMHSTGIAMIHKTKKGTRWAFHKQTLPSTFFLAQKGVQDLIHQEKPMVIMGHSRHATAGAITYENSQPLHKGHIIGAHNGTINKFAPDKDQDKVRSDSHKVFELIRDHGIDYTVEKIGHTGAYALTWLNTKEGTLNIVRNDERPLWFMWNRSHETLYWASEDYYLEFMEQNASEAFSICQRVATLTHYTVDYTTGRNIQLHERKLEIKKARPVWTRDQQGPFHGWGALNDYDEYGSTHCLTCKKPWLECEGHEEDKKSPPWKEDVGTPAPKIIQLEDKSGKKKERIAYCKRCRKVFIGGCKCDGKTPYFPNEWEINDKGEWVDDHKLGLAPTTPPTSVPSVNKVVPTFGQRYPGWSPHDTYIGFERKMIDPKAAAHLLSSTGCTVCGIISEVREQVWFYSWSEHICDSCHDKPEAKDIIGRRSTWLGILKKASEGSKHVH